MRQPLTASLFRRRESIWASAPGGIVSLTTLNKNSNGFTLVEVMVAIVIMMVGMLGLLEAVNVAMEFNLKNQLRDEAVYMGERYMNELKGQGFDAIAATYATISTASKVRGAGKRIYVDRSSQVLSTDSVGPTSKQLIVVIRWNYKGMQYQNRVMAPISIAR
nr:prepilin-type N-terminal cleavage/methylation domain-containing protein [Geobacter argillaceus]